MYSELETFVTAARNAGQSDGQIRDALERAGWSNDDIVTSLRTETPLNAQQTSVSIVHKSTVAIISLSLVVIALSAVTATLAKNRIELSDRNDAAARQFLANLAAGSIGFTDAGELVFPDDKKFLDAKQALIDAGEKFVEADLDAMTIRLWEKGAAVGAFPILGKGKEGSWWETPTGSYEALSKQEQHFSSIGQVWMPWSIQFYGNFFIHGWPYYENGTPVPQGYSGGCIRLSTDDAKTLYTFVTIGVPILVHDMPDAEASTLLVDGSAPVPDISARSFVVIDLITGKALLEKRADELQRLGALTHLMSGIVASELIYLDRSIRVEEGALAALLTAFQPKVGERYIAFDLLYPLLMQSSNESANILAHAIGESRFLGALNTKAGSLSMRDTTFVDISDTQNNRSTARDLGTLLQYLYHTRAFILDITKGTPYNSTTGTHASSIENHNPFAENEALIGALKAGTDAHEHLASAWNIKTPSGKTSPIGIVVLDSPDAKGDTESLRLWISPTTQK